MRIEHIAIWVKDLELMKNFYVKYFNAKCSNKYSNKKKEFTSYFISFNESKTRIELMNNPYIKDLEESKNLYFGLAHMAISVGSKKNVDQLTQILRKDVFSIIGEPRTTGDGYYESIIEDCEGNCIELTE